MPAVHGCDNVVMTIILRPRRLLWRDNDNNGDDYDNYYDEINNDDNNDDTDDAIDDR